jgi:hypothetical protein
VAEGIDELRRQITSAGSPRLDSLFEKMEAPARAFLLEQQNTLNSRLVEELVHSKFAFWSHIPYKLVGVFNQSGSIEAEDRAKAIYRECAAEFDAAIAAGLPLHRVSILVLSRNGIIRQELDSWSQGPKFLRDYPNAFCTILEYALCSLVERRVEEVHAHIKRLGKSMGFVLCPYVCALLRESQHINRLREDAAFHDIACPTGARKGSWMTC